MKWLLIKFILIFLPLIIVNQCIDTSFRMSLIVDINVKNISGTVLIDPFGTSNMDTFLTNSLLTSNNCLLFNGSTDWAITQQNIYGAFNSPSMSIFIYFQYLKDGVLVDELGQTTPNISWHDTLIEVVGGFVYFRVWKSGNQCIKTTYKLTVGQFYHIGFTYNYQEKILNGYVNGQNVSVNFQVNRNLSSNQAFYFALGVNDVTNCGDGTFGGFCLRTYQIYNDALKDSQISTLYQYTINNF